MNIPLIFEAVAVILACIEIARSHAQSLIGWAVLLVALALLWHLFR